MILKSRTFIAIPPGVTIKEQLADRGMSQKEFAQRMDLSQKHVSKLINGDVQLTKDVARRLEMVLGLPASFWNRLEDIYREKLVNAEAENQMDADREFARKFPYVEMAKNGWVAEANDWFERVVALRKFFEVANLELITDMSLFGNASRRTPGNEKSDFAFLAWAQRAKLEARAVKAKPLNPIAHRRTIPEICRMTVQNPDEFCPRLEKLLAECGVAIVFIPEIGRSFIHSASFLDNRKMVLGMTVRGMDADKFWFGLFREIGRILLGHAGKPGGLTEEDEAQADVFARETLIPAKVFGEFTDRGEFTLESIREFARDNGIRAGIVVRRLQEEGFLDEDLLNGLKVQYQLSD